MRTIGRDISILSRQFNIYIAKELQAIDIMTSEYIFVINIEKGIKTNQKELCDIFALNKAAATRAISSLMRKGYVNRERNPDNKREYLLSLTKEGEKIKPVILEKLTKWTELLTADLSDEQTEEVADILAQFRKNACKENTHE